MRALGTVLTTTSLLAAGTALAADKPAFADADANDDGRVSIEEATRAGVSEREAKVSDLDEDGMLTEGDWKFVDVDGSEEAEPPSS
ncbi:hypothetical protein [Algiphilus sp.]|uniref:hypothetical protein n=1 Tax=Algiphilus sp. TaxID=1872431 RepID=UPI0025BB836F|nr:hypothetical protein [Algiphilus sp.]MCK5769079.1 hypothetical protein [Algiphilus sp.]